MTNSEDNELIELRAKIRNYESWRGDDTLQGKTHFGQFEPESVDVKALFLLLWNHKVRIAILTFVFGLIAAVYALILPNMYTSTIKLIPAQQDQQNGLSSLASRYGGLAAMAGINLGNGESNSVIHAIELMKSWPYIDDFVNKYHLKAKLMAVDSWDVKTNELVYDDTIYNAKENLWELDNSLFADGTKRTEPTSFETYKEIMKRFLSVKYDEESSILEISFTHYSPFVAYELTNLLASEVNEYFRKKDQEEAIASIAFIEKQIESTSNTQMLEVFYSMIESHTQTMMLAEVNDEYLVKTLIPAKISDPEEKSKPNRVFLVLLGLMLGIMIGVLSVLFAALRK